jgi:hypothetical protein
MRASALHTSDVMKHKAKSPAPAASRASSSRRPDVEAVMRRCLVCEWQDAMVEPAAADPDCPWCHAPTVRVAAPPAIPAPEGKNPHAAALGRLGGAKGGRARAEALTPTQRRRIASQAARARWAAKKKSR